MTRRASAMGLGLCVAALLLAGCAGPEERATEQELASAEISRGEQALLARKYVTAIKHFEEAERRDRLSDHDARRLDGLLRVARKGEEEYRSFIRQTLAEARLADQKGDTTKAIKDYETVVAADVHLPESDREYARTRLALLKETHK